MKKAANKLRTILGRVYRNIDRELERQPELREAFAYTRHESKLFYCACQRIKEKWDMPVRDWAATISHLNIFFPNRIKIELN